jgi:transcriptional regulator with XRE-family HTH domain
MADYRGVTTIRKRLAGGQLRRLREACGMTADEVADKLGVSRHTVRRQEAGQTAVSVADVEAYMRVYQVKDEAVVSRLTDLAKHGRVRGWWSAYDATVGPTAADIADAEDLATGIKSWQPLSVPGLLQTREYSEAVIGVRRGLLGDTEDSPTAERLELRERRKEILLRDNPPQIWAIIGEAAILTQVGSRAVMDGQRQHLLELAERPNISMQILPFSAGAHAGMSGAFVVMSFDETLDGGIVYVENSGGEAFNDDPAEVRQRVDRFAHLQAQGLSIAETRRYLQDAISAK